MRGSPIPANNLLFPMPRAARSILDPREFYPDDDGPEVGA